MQIRRVLLYIVLVAVGCVAGFSANSWLSSRGFEEAAKANLYLSGESLRNNDPVGAMAYAQSARCNAPNAYDPYEAIGDIYLKLGNPMAARKMYEAAIGRLASGDRDSMPFTKGVVSAEGATKLIKRKVEGLPPGD